MKTNKNVSSVNQNQSISWIINKVNIYCDLFVGHLKQYQQKVQVVKNELSINGNNH